MPEISAHRRALCALTVLGLLLAGGRDGIALPQSSRPVRVLGVFDDVTGQPLAGVEVVDLTTGTRAITSTTGTISLAWLGPGTTILQARKVGFRNRFVPVSTSPADTVPITLVLVPIAPSLPAVITTARARADTVRKLTRAGFYDRRQSSGAPASAFVTAEQLDKWKPSLLSDLEYRTGRKFMGACDDIYVDGILLSQQSQLRLLNSTRKQGIDALVAPEDVAGMEIYRVGDVPAQYNRTVPPGCPPDRHVLLIWLK